MAPSKTLLTTVDETLAWLERIVPTEADITDIFALISPELHADALRSIEMLKEMFSDDVCVGRWPTPFTGISAIVNRRTFSHRDRGGRKPWYDLLLAAGSYTESYLDLEDLNARLAYKPGTVVALCGMLLRHSVHHWTGGERICYAHYMRDNVLYRLQIQAASWVREKLYAEEMSRGFRDRMTRRVSDRR